MTQGEMAATAVNAPMMPPEVLKELQPFVSLAAGLGRAAVQLASDGFSDVTITYRSPRGDDLDTRLLRAMVIKARTQRARVLFPSLVDMPAHTARCWALLSAIRTARVVNPFPCQRRASRQLLTASSGHAVRKVCQALSLWLASRLRDAPSHARNVDSIAVHVMCCVRTTMMAQEAPQRGEVPVRRACWSR